MTSILRVWSSAGCVLVVGTEAGIADAVPAGVIGASGGLSDGLDGVGACLRSGWSDGEKDRISVSGGLAMEFGLGGIGAPAVGELEGDRAVGCGLGVDGDADGKRAAIERQDAGLRSRR